MYTATEVSLFVRMRKEKQRLWAVLVQRGERPGGARAPAQHYDTDNAGRMSAEHACMI